MGLKAVHGYATCNPKNFFGLQIAKYKVVGVATSDVSLRKLLKIAGAYSLLVSRHRGTHDERDHYGFFPAAKTYEPTTNPKRRNKISRTGLTQPGRSEHSHSI